MKCSAAAARLPADLNRSVRVQLKNADQILAEDKHLPLYEVRAPSS